MERLKHPAPRPDDDESLDVRTRLELRCPFCHDELPAGAVASACAACGTVHHVSCFTEHRGCATDGCGGTAAKTLTVGAPSDGLRDARFDCRRCRGTAELDELVVRCRGCGFVLHGACYDAEGRCPGGRCAGAPSEVLPLRELVLQVERRDAWAQTLGGAFLVLIMPLVGAVGLIVDGSVPPLIAAALLAATIPGWVLLMLGRRRWQRVAALTNAPRAVRSPSKPPESGSPAKDG